MNKFLSQLRFIIYSASTLFFLSALFIPVYAQVEETDTEDEKETSDPFIREFVYAPTIDELLEGELFDYYDEQRAEQVARHLTNTGLDLGGGFEAGPYYSNDLFSQYPNLPTWRYNRVNGLFIGIKKERMQWHRRSSFMTIPQLQPHGFVGYGTASREWEYAFGVERLFGENERLMIGAEFHRGTVTDDYWRTGLIENNLSSIFAGYDFLDYYKADGFGIYLVHRTGRWIEAAFSYNTDEFSSFEQNTDFSLFGSSGTFRPNPPLDENADQISMDRYAFSLSLNPRRALLFDRFTFSTSGGMELANNSRTDRDYRYNKYWADFKLFYNIDPGSVLRWRVKTGSITGNVPDFKAFYLGGIGTLRGSPHKFFTGNQKILSNLELKLGTPGAAPGNWLRTYNLHFLVFLDSGWITQNETLLTADTPLEGFGNFKFDDMQHDAGVGLGTGSLRFEIAWPLSTFDGTPGLWVRFNPTF